MCPVLVVTCVVARLSDSICLHCVTMSLTHTAYNVIDSLIMLVLILTVRLLVCRQSTWLTVNK